MLLNNVDLDVYLWTQSQKLHTLDFACMGLIEKAATVVRKAKHQ